MKDEKFNAVKELDIDQQVMEDVNNLVDKEINFITLPDGQWEESVKNKWGADRPRYTLDITSANIAKAWSEMAQNEYVSSTSPAGGGASKEVSEILDGVLRETYERTSFDSTSAFAGKRMISVGEAAWRVGTEYEPKTFNQRFTLTPLYDSNQRVWWDSASTMRDRSDAKWVTITTYVQDDEIAKRWPDADSAQSVSTTRSNLQELNKPEDRKLIGERVYKEPYEVELHLMDDGTIVEGVEGKNNPGAMRTRTEIRHKIMSRHFDNNGWLDKTPKELPFTIIPIIPIYANFSVIDGKVLFHGMIRQIMDHARIYNYVQSRKVEDSVLGIPDHMMVADKQADGYQDRLSKINRSANRVHVYKHVDGMPPPYVNRGSQPNMALSELSNDMVNSIQLTTGLPMTLVEMESRAKDSDFRANRRDTIGQMGTYEYYKGYSIGLELTSRVILGAVPRVMDAQAMIKVISESGLVSEVEINKNENGQLVNDLTTGDYDVTVNVGASLKDRQAEANSAILEAGAIDPTIIGRNTDIIAGNINAPGMKEVSERERAHQVKIGNVTPEQYTDEEKEQAAAAQQNQQPDPASMIAQAELERSKTENETAQFKALEAQAKLELVQNKQATDTAIASAQIELKERELALKEREQGDKEELNDTQRLLNVSNAIENLEKTDQTIDNTTLDNVEANI